MISKSQRTSINKAKTGRKGPNNTNGYPVVLSEALSASNNKCTKVQFSASSTSLKRALCQKWGETGAKG